MNSGERRDISPTTAWIVFAVVALVILIATGMYKTVLNEIVSVYYFIVS